MSVEKSNDEIISFTVPVTRGEFALWTWASRQKHGQSLNAYTLEAMNAAVSETVKDLAARGKPIPQFVAEALDKKRGEIKPTGSKH